MYSCQSRRIIPSISESVVNVTGSHLEGRSNADVSGLIVDNQQDFNRIPRNIEAFFPNLTFLRWLSGDLTSIVSDDLKPFPALAALVLGHNKIFSLNGDLFQHTPKMIVISFSDNVIEHVGFDLLTNLSGLTHAYFANNICINQNAETPEEMENLLRHLSIHCRKFLI